jgi:hypothetical protein
VPALPIPTPPTCNHRPSPPHTGDSDVLSNNCADVSSKEVLYDGGRATSSSSFIVSSIIPKSGIKTKGRIVTSRSPNLGGRKIANGRGEKDWNDRKKIGNITNASKMVRPATSGSATSSRANTTTFCITTRSDDISTISIFPSSQTTARCANALPAEIDRDIGSVQQVVIAHAQTDRQADRTPERKLTDICV